MTVTPKQLANLIPGKSPGRTKGSISFLTAIKARYRKNPELLEELAKALEKKALSGDSKCLNILLDRLDGKVTENLNVKTDGKLDITLSFNNDSKDKDD